ncbi:Haloacid dehalogenase-like hydrolase domain-containing protein 3, partial [Rhizophlyctis rosea]
GAGIEEGELKPVFEDVFRDLYDGFTKADKFEVFPDVPQTLTQLHQKGVTLGIITNVRSLPIPHPSYHPRPAFSSPTNPLTHHQPTQSDDRTLQIIHSLSLHTYFTFILTSYACGLEKPDPRIFQEALRLANLDDPRGAMHVGDHLERDYEGAIEAGWKALIVDRGAERSGEGVVRSLEELSEMC